MAPDVLSGQSGTLGRRALLRARLHDWLADRLPIDAPAGPHRRVRVLAVDRPDGPGALRAAVEELNRSRHDVEGTVMAEPGDQGKFQNLNALLLGHPPGDADWLLVLDDDVRLPAGFLDRFLAVADALGLALAQPAHAFASHAAWPVTRRIPGALAHETRFVEIGPVTALHRRTFDVLLPFPDELRMGWGLDLHWGAVAARQGWKLGVVDVTPVRHLAPVAGGYAHAEAVAEAEAFLAGRPYVPASAANEVLRVVRP